MRRVKNTECHDVDGGIFGTPSLLDDCAWGIFGIPDGKKDDVFLIVR